MKREIERERGVECNRVWIRSKEWVEEKDSWGRDTNRVRKTATKKGERRMREKEETM